MTIRPRRVARPHALALLLVLTACIGSGPPRRVAPARPVALADLPTAVGPYKLVASRHYTDPDPGVAAHYTDGGPLRVDVYLYPVPAFAGARRGTVLPAKAALDRVTLRFWETIDNLALSHWWTDYQVAYEEDVTVPVPHGSVRGHLAMLSVQQPNVAEMFAFYIFDVHNRYVEIRMTVRSRRFEKGVPMKTFARELITTMARDSL